jgi:hypothetical protein
MSGTSDDVAVDGALTAAISTAMVSLLHSYTGRGPTRARTTIGETRSAPSKPNRAAGWWPS